MVTQTLAPASIPPGRRVYAIGDVHGCADRLARLHDLILADLRARPVPRAVVVHLGDYVDRGPDSAGVLDRLTRAEALLPGVQSVTLRGNHEQMMLEALLTGDANAVRHWLGNGGSDTLRSWGVRSGTPAAEWLRSLPDPHLALLSGLPLTHTEGGYLFVHAGLRPGVAWDAQDPEDLLWIREPFLSSSVNFGVVVVHGHTPSPVPALRANRIGIDTGAVMGGALTCAVLQDDGVGFLQS